jgi:hypothetical protein
MKARTLSSQWRCDADIEKSNGPDLPYHIAPLTRARWPLHAPALAKTQRQNVDADVAKTRSSPFIYRLDGANHHTENLKARRRRAADLL